MEIFDEDFKHFAIANGVSNEEWLEMNAENPEKATELVEIFSDTVLQKVYEKLRFIEHRSQTSCLVFNLLIDEIQLISINSKNETVDLSTPESIHEALVNSPQDISIFETKKAYSKNREEEIHDMLMQGCFNSSEAFWILLKKVIND